MSDTKLNDAGAINRIERDGDSVRRPLHRWTASVHSVLRYLTSLGFDGAPAPLGIDRHRGVEVVSYIEGDVALRPWPGVLRSDSGLRQLGDFLCRYHRVVQDFVPPTDAVWHVPNLAWKPETSSDTAT